MKRLSIFALLTLAVTGVFILQVLRGDDPAPVDAPAPAAQPNDDEAKAAEVDERHPVAQPQEPVAEAVAPDTGMDDVEAEGSDIAEVNPHDEERRALIRKGISRLEQMLVSDEGLDDHKTWLTVKNLIGPVCSIQLDREGRGNITGGERVEKRDEDLLFLGFGRSYRIYFADFPELEELTAIADYSTGSVPPHVRAEMEDRYTLDEDSRASAIATFIAKANSEL